ncbi:MAG: nodulation protein NfeD, partial [Proteobacteria bacterium]|nr:nodulation protein NfeD [Pseudomonadota bacterium]
MKYRVFIWLACLAAAVVIGAVTGDDPSAAARAAAAPRVMLVNVQGIVSPASAQFVVRAVRRAEDQNMAAMVIRLDTPGGLVSSMKDMVKAIRNARVPVVVYVAPRGAGAVSAGVFIVLAAHVAAMAPNTTIGAASPVTLGKKMGETMKAKAFNHLASYARSLAEGRRKKAIDWAEQAVRKAKSITATKALELEVVDYVADDLRQLLNKIHGHKVKVAGAAVTLDTKGARLVEYAKSWRDDILELVANPNLAYILLTIGIMGLYFEFTNPGAVFPGVVGGISLILALFAMQTLSVNWAGLALIGLAMILFLAEIKITSYGMLSVGGVISLVLGSIFLFEEPGQLVGISLSVLIPTVVLVSGFFVACTYLVVRAHRRRAMTGYAGMIGLAGVVKTDIVPGAE